MLKLKLQSFGHLIGRADSFEKTPMLRKIEGRRRRGRQRMRWLDGQWTWVWVNSRSWWWTGRPGVLWFLGSQRVGHDWATELNWTELILHKAIYRFHAICVKIPPPFLWRNRKAGSKFIRNCKRHRIGKTSWKVEGLTHLNFRTYYKSTAIKTMWYWQG